MEHGVSAFIVGTCRTLPKSHTDVSQCMESPKVFSGQVRGYAVFCGSTAEFFIQPLHRCIGDVDVLHCKQDELAFSDGIPVMPYDVRYYVDKIACYLIEPYSYYPAFIRLRCFGQMNYNLDSRIFDFEQVNDREYLKGSLESAGIENGEKGVIAGPAHKIFVPRNPSLTHDFVKGIWCPQWPKQAKNWPSRRINYRWPTNATIREVVQNGCHVVRAKHPACKDDIHQWRMSFSVAEVILLQSWTQNQQLVYHMLRFFAKRELIRKNCPKEDEVLCNYHLKTLMLWSCEEMSPEWWNSSSVIAICCNLLQKLAKWLRKRKCPNYFIPEANLFHENVNRKIVHETVEILIHSCNTDNLSNWFVEHYMKPTLPHESLFNNIHICEVSSCFCECLLYVCEALKAAKPKCIDLYFSRKLHFNIHYSIYATTTGMFIFENPAIFKYDLRTGSVVSHVNKFLPSLEIESYFELCDSMQLALHAAHALECSAMRYDIEWLRVIVRQVSNKPKRVRFKYYNFPMPWKTFLKGSQLCFVKAHDLMTCLTGSNGHLEFKLVSQLSNVFLRKALECHDSKSKTIASATVAYMAALHFAASEYQTAIDYCTTVIINQTPEDEQKDIETLFNSDDIVRIFGFYLLVVHIREDLLYRRRRFFLELTLTSEILAQHLRMLKNEKRPGAIEPVNAGCLFYIDDIVRITGFYLLFKQITENLHYSRRRFLLDLRLTPEVFAQHLLILINERRPGAFQPNCDLQPPTFPFDEILMVLTKHKSCAISRQNFLCVYQRTAPANTLEALSDNSDLNDELAPTLMEYALENATSFYNAICKDLGIQLNVADCYRAAYLYKCRKYTDVLDLCERILNEPDITSDLRTFAFANVMVIPPFESFFDRDIQCLLGFQTLSSEILTPN